MLRWLPENVSSFGGDIDAAFALIYYIDQDAEDTRWILDWVAQALTPTEQQWLAGLAARFTEVFPRAG